MGVIMLSFKEFLQEAFTSPDSKLSIKRKFPSGLLVIPRTHEACKKYGMNTKWCITQNEPNYWNDYIGKQKLTPYMFIPNEEYKIKLTKMVGNDKLDLSKLIIMVDKENKIKHMWDAKDINLTTELGMNKCLEMLKLLGLDEKNFVSIESESMEETFKFDFKLWREVLDTVKERTMNYGLDHLYDLMLDDDVYDVAKKIYNYYIKQNDLTYEGGLKAVEKYEYDIDYVGPVKDSKTFKRLFDKMMNEIFTLRDEEENKTPVKIKDIN